MESSELTVFTVNQGGTAVEYYRPWSLSKASGIFYVVKQTNPTDNSSPNLPRQIAGKLNAEKSIAGSSAAIVLLTGGKLK